MKQICVVGVGYVGLVTAACFSDLGNRVIALDVVEERINGLKQGKLPIYEPGLKGIGRTQRSGRGDYLLLHHTPRPLSGTEFVFIAVGTPMGVDGEADLHYLEAAAREVAENMTASTGDHQ